MSKQNKKRGQTNLELNFFLGFWDTGIFRRDEIQKTRNETKRKKT